MSAPSIRQQLARDVQLLEQALERAHQHEDATFRRYCIGYISGALAQARHALEMRAAEATQ